MLEKINEDLKSAMKGKDRLTVDTLRLLISRIKNEEIQKKEKLTDPEIAVLVKKEIKKRKEAIELYKKGGREDLAEKESSESTILEAYLPKQVSGEELAGIIASTIEEMNATGPSDMGKVMKEIMSKYPGRVDGKQVRELVQEKLSSL